MKSYSREAQLAQLHKMGTGALLSRMQAGSVAIALACLAAGYFHHPAWFPFAGFLAVVVFASRSTAVHIRNAARAIRAGARHPAVVDIVIDTSSDSDSYHATVHARSQVWKFEFIPLYWKPIAGRFAGEAVYLAEMAWPVLCFIGENVIYPRYEPKSIESPPLDQSPYKSGQG